MLFSRYSIALADQNDIRTKHALQTLGILLKSIFRKKWNNFATDILSLLTGVDMAEKQFQVLPIFLSQISTQKNLLAKTRF